MFIPAKVATTSRLGEVRLDGSTIVADEDGVISVEAKNLLNATSTRYGVVKYDGETIKVNSSGKLYVDAAAVKAAIEAL